MITSTPNEINVFSLFVGILCLGALLGGLIAAIASEKSQKLFRNILNGGCIFAVIFIFFGIIAVFYLLVNTIHPPACCGPGPYPLIANSGIKSIDLGVSYPDQMFVNESQTIDVVLQPEALFHGNSISSRFTPTVTSTNIASSNSKVVTTNLTPVGTPSTSILDAFGTGYEPFAIATLYATTFKIGPEGPQEQSLRQNAVGWNWNITPQNVGIQTLDINLKLQWRPTDSNKQALTQTFTTGEVQFKIEVVNHFLTIGTIDLATILTQSLPAFIGGMILFATGGAGIGFAGKWVRGRFEKWLSRRKDSKSPQTLTHSNTNHQNRKSSKREKK